MQPPKRLGYRARLDTEFRSRLAPYLGVRSIFFELRVLTSSLHSYKHQVLMEEVKTFWRNVDLERGDKLATVCE